MFLDAHGVTTREIDTQPGTLLTYSTASGRIRDPFSGVLHTTYPQGAVVGAPAELIITGNSGPFNDVPMGSGRLTFAGTVVDTRSARGPIGSPA